MWKYTVRRLLIAAVVLFIISILDFAFINIAPGDPIRSDPRYWPLVQRLGLAD